MTNPSRYPDPDGESDLESPAGIPRWVKLVGLSAAVLVLLFVVMLLVGGGGHRPPFQH